MTTYTKKCPVCNNEMIYTGKYAKGNLKRSIKRSLLCNSCKLLGKPRPNEVKNKISLSLKGHKISEETKNKISIGNKGKKQSDATKNKLSEITKFQWKQGIHKPKLQWKSKEQIEISNLIKNLGYNVKEEYFIDGRPFDILIPSTNTIIEFNGTYWHCDPRVYSSDYYFSPRKIIAKELWKNDKEKITLAESKGYKVKVIWQMDWRACNDKMKYLKSII